MSNDTSNTILKAIETMVKNEVNQLQADITAQGVITKLFNKLERKYEATYQGITIFLYAKEGDTYNKGDKVYFVIPKGDLSEKKIIQGLTSPSEVSEPFYTNGPTWDIIYKQDWAGPYGLTMGKEEKTVLIYNNNSSNEDADLFAWGIGAAQFSIQATFWTKVYDMVALGIEEVLEGEFGIRVTLETPEGESLEYTLTPVGLLEQVDLLGEKKTITRTFVLPNTKGAFSKLKSIEFYQKEMILDEDSRAANRWNLLVKDIKIGYTSSETNELYQAILRKSKDEKSLYVSLLDRMNSNDFFEEELKYCQDNVRVHFYKENLYSNRNKTLGTGWEEKQITRDFDEDFEKRKVYILEEDLKAYNNYKAIVVIHLTKQMKEIIAANSGISPDDLSDSLKFITNNLIIWGDEGEIDWAAQSRTPNSTSSSLQLFKYIYNDDQWINEDINQGLNSQYYNFIYALIKEDGTVVIQDKENSGYYNGYYSSEKGVGLKKYKDYKNYTIRMQHVGDNKSKINYKDLSDFPCYGFWEWSSRTGSSLTRPDGTKVL